MNPIAIRPFLLLKLFTFGALALTGACHFPGVKGDGRVVTETRDISDFTTVEAGGAVARRLPEPHHPTSYNKPSRNAS